MSQLIGAALPVNIRAANDIRNCDQRFFGLRSRAPSPQWSSSEMSNRADNAYPLYRYATRWWPRRSQLLGGWGDGLEGDYLQNLTPRWVDPFTRRGCNGRLGFTNYTRDQYGSATGGCTVRLYRVADDSLQAKVVSDANGLYFATTPYNDAHFMTVHNPDGTQGGATATNLIPG